MKNKKFICDYESKLIGKYFYLTVAILCIISCIITFHFLNMQYEKEIASCTSQDYIYLKEVANSICDKENKALLLTDIPNSVKMSDIKCSDENFVFSCTLNKNFKVASSPFVTVTIDKDYKNVEIVENKNSKVIVIILSFCLGMLFILFLALIYLIIIGIICSRSLKKKYNY